MTNPQAFKELEEARKNNVDPQEYLNKITGAYSKEQKEEWDMLMQSIGMNTK